MDKRFDEQSGPDRDDDDELIVQIEDLFRSVNGVESQPVVATPVPLYDIPSKRPRYLWTPKDDDLIIDALRRHGAKWRTIARELQLGSDDSIRNRVARFQVESLPSDVKNVVRVLHAKRMSKQQNVLTRSTSKRIRRFGSGGASDGASDSGSGSGDSFDGFSYDGSGKGRRKRMWSREEDLSIVSAVREQRKGAWKRLSEGPLFNRSKHAIRNRASRLGVI